MARQLLIKENEAGGFELSPEPAGEWPVEEVASVLFATLGRVLAMVLPAPPKREKKKVEKYTNLPPGLRRPGNNGGN